MSKSIHLFTIGLYLFDTLLSILVLKKEYNYNQENKQIQNYMNILIHIDYFELFFFFFIHYDIQLLCSKFEIEILLYSLFQI